MEGGTEASKVGGKSLPPAEDGRDARGEPKFPWLHGLLNPARPQSGPGRSLGLARRAFPPFIFPGRFRMFAACGRWERRGEGGRRAGEEQAFPFVPLFLSSLVGRRHCSGYKGYRDLGGLPARVVGYCDLATLTRKERWFRCMCWGGSRG